jgi:hypothetical protein
MRIIVCSQSSAESCGKKTSSALPCCCYNGDPDVLFSSTNMYCCITVIYMKEAFRDPDNLTQLARSLVERFAPYQEEMNSNPRRDKNLAIKWKTLGVRYST